MASWPAAAAHLAPGQLGLIDATVLANPRQLVTDSR
jgi:hypothetical protein